MNKDLWISKVIAGKEVLTSLIARYHPVNTQSHKDSDIMDAYITAPNAERACEEIRKEIRSTTLDCPQIQFHLAIEKQDWDTTQLLFGDTWIGIPESNSCWSIPGFSLMVDLMDDPIETEEYNQN